MKSVNFSQELKFIQSEKVKNLKKDSLTFELLNIAQIVLSNYAIAETKKLKLFYQTIYFKTKHFYLEEKESKVS